MPVITNSQLQVWLDKFARFCTEAVGDPEFSAGFNAGMEKGSMDVFSGAGALAAYLLTLTDEDVIADLLPTARDLDEQHPTPPDGFLLTVKEISAALTAMDKHVQRYAGAKSLDDHLSTLNAATPTLRAHGHFRKYLGKIAAKNSFIPNDLDLASFTASGAAAGTYSHLSAVDKTKYAGAKLVLKNVGALTTGPVVSVSARKLDGTLTTLTATISVLTDAHETDLSDTTKLYVDTTNITIASGGTSGDVFKVVAKTDRSIASA